MSTAPVTLDFSKAQPIQPSVTFDFSKAQPIQDMNAERGAAQATGLSPDKRGPIGRAFDEVKAGLTAAQPGGGLTPQPTALGNAAEFFGMAGDTASRLAGPTEAAAGAGALSEKAASVLKPTPSIRSIGTGLYDGAGKEIMKDVVEYGPSKLAQQVQKLLPEKATVDQAEKIARLVYHIGAGTGLATYLYHELYGSLK